MYTFKNRSNKDILSDRTIRRRAAARAQELLHSKRRKTIDINEPYTEPQHLNGVNEQCSHTRDIHIQLEDTYTDHDSSIDDRESFVHVDENLSVRENATKYRDAHFEMETYTSAMDSDTDLSSVVSGVSHDADESPFKERLREWVVNSKTPLVHTNSLLSLLKPHFPSLPKDARTLLQTEKVYTIEDRAGGKYHHFGIMEGLLHELKNDDKLCKCSNLSLQIGIDGLPLFRSSNESFWPILCIVKEKINAEPFIIGLWVGSSKPTDPNDYLEPFICEMGCLMENGLTFHGKDYTVSVKNFVCDTPARSFIKFTKGNTGYHGCDFCECRGRYFMNRVTFPDMNSPARTDEAFASMQCSEHHRGQSDLQNLDIGMVTCFPLDYMHSVCLGTMRRVLSLWVKGPFRVRIGNNCTKSISESLMICKTHMPREFVRKGRSLQELDRWKATEFRTFLLYTGPVVLKGMLKDNVYKHFLMLFVSITILSDSQFCTVHCDYVQALLKTYVQHFGTIYGEENIIYNTHSLIHISEHCKRFGPLHEFSAFPFENYLQAIKKLIRKPNFPLQQTIRRLSEKRQIKTVPHLNGCCYLCKDEHNHGPLPRILTGAKCSQYNQIYLEKFMLATKQPDNVILINKDTYIIRNIVLHEEKHKCVCTRFDQKESFFNYPLDSQDINISLVGGLSDNLEIFDIEDITTKVVLLPYKRRHSVSIPMRLY